MLSRTLMRMVAEPRYCKHVDMYINYIYITLEILVKILRYRFDDSNDLVGVFSIDLYSYYIVLCW